MNLLRSLILIAATAAVAACNSGSTLPETDPDLAGTLTEFLPGPAILGAPTRVLVEPPAAPEDRAIVQVEKGTEVYLVGRGGRLIPAGVEDLAAGDHLQVWTTGVELRSLPAQVFAERVHIIR